MLLEINSLPKCLISCEGSSLKRTSRWKFNAAQRARCTIGFSIRASLNNGELVGEQKFRSDPGRSDGKIRVQRPSQSLLSGVSLLDFLCAVAIVAGTATGTAAAAAAVSHNKSQ